MTFRLFENITFQVKTALATFWANFEEHEVYYPLAQLMGCEIVDRHLEMAKPTITTKRKVERDKEPFLPK